MSILEWSNYIGMMDLRPNDPTIGSMGGIKWSKDDLLAHLDNRSMDVSESSSRGYKFMHVAAVNGWTDVIDKLHARDSDMKDAQSESGVTPLMVAASYPEFFKRKYEPERPQRDPTSVANPIETIKHLLKLGADPKIVNVSGHNLLHIAATNGNKLVADGNYFFNHIHFNIKQWQTSRSVIAVCRIHYFLWPLMDS